MNAQQQGEFVEGRFESPHGARRYKLFTPSETSPPGQRALVVMLHGCTQDADDIARGTRLNERAGARGWLVLYPEQPATANPQKCWNWFDRAHQTRDRGEPALLAALITEVAHRRGIDPRRVFIAGISAGGAMVVSLVVAYPELFRAAAVHSALPHGSAGTVMEALGAMREGPRTPTVLEAIRVPLTVIHGERDAVVVARNGELLATQWRAAIEKAFGTTLVERDDAGRAADGGTYRRVLYGAGSDLPLVEWWTVHDLGHAWSGGSSSGTFTDPRGPDATSIMLDFFARHDAVAPRR